MKWAALTKPITRAGLFMFKIPGANPLAFSSSLYGLAKRMNGRVGAQLCHHSYSAGMMIFCAAPGCALDCDRHYLKSM
jgi:hypothetical protein